MGLDDNCTIAWITELKRYWKWSLVKQTRWDMVGRSGTAALFFPDRLRSLQRKAWQLWSVVSSFTGTPEKKKQLQSTGKCGSRGWHESPRNCHFSTTAFLLSSEGSGSKEETVRPSSSPPLVPVLSDVSCQAGSIPRWLWTTGLPFGTGKQGLEKKQWECTKTQGGLLAALKEPNELPIWLKCLGLKIIQIYHIKYYYINMLTYFTYIQYCILVLCIFCVDHSAVRHTDAQKLYFTLTFVCNQRYHLFVATSQDFLKCTIVWAQKTITQQVFFSDGWRTNTAISIYGVSSYPRAWLLKI